MAAINIKNKREGDKDGDKLKTWLTNVANYFPGKKQFIFTTLINCSNFYNSMAKKRRNPTAQTEPSRLIITERKDSLKNLKVELRRHPKWPNLKVSDWRPIACRHFKVDRIHHTDPLYKQLHMFCGRPNQYQMKKLKAVPLNNPDTTDMNN